MSETTDTILAGLRGQLERLAADARERAKTDQRQAVEAMQKAAGEQMARIDKRIDALARRHSLEPALWGMGGGVLLAVAMLLIGVALGVRGISVHWLLTFGWGWR